MQEGPASNQLRPWDGKSPISLAGVIVFVVAKLPKATQHPDLADVCAVCGVAEATIRALYKDMHPFLVRRAAWWEGCWGCRGAGGDVGQWDPRPGQGCITASADTLQNARRRGVLDGLNISSWHWEVHA